MRKVVYTHRPTPRTEHVILRTRGCNSPTKLRILKQCFVGTVWQVTKYREKLSDLEYYRSRVEELRQDNRVLEETREMLEEQLARARKRGDHLLELEASILQYKQTINDLVLVGGNFVVMYSELKQKESKQKSY